VISLLKLSGIIFCNCTGPKDILKVKKKLILLLIEILIAKCLFQDPNAIVSPGGVGFDINCGVRLLRTNLTEKDVHPVKEQLAQSLFDHIPVSELIEYCITSQMCKCTILQHMSS
jgi:hypothetical protein